MRQEIGENILSRFRFTMVGVTLLAVLAAIGCTSNSIPMPTTPEVTPTPPTPPPSTYTINMASKELIGNYLVDGRGTTLYYTVSDRPGYSNLPDGTLSSWPAFYVSNILVPPSLNASNFGTYTRSVSE